MSDPIIRYNLDKTGLNPDNRIVNEPHLLTDLQESNRIIIPNAAPFFANSVILFDNATNQIKFRGVHFDFIELAETASMECDNEIYFGLAITDPNVSNDLLMTYQTLGGNYQVNINPIMRSWMDAISLDSPLNYGNILNLPKEFPVGYHTHLMQDTVGYQYLINAIELLTNAIQFRNIPMAEELINYINNRLGVGGVITEDEIDDYNPLNKLITFERLLYMINRLSFNTITYQMSSHDITAGYNITVTVNTTNTTDDVNYYWIIIHQSTEDADFNARSGVVNMVNNKGTFIISTRANDGGFGNKLFKVGICLGSTTNTPISQTPTLTLLEPSGSSVDLSDYIIYSGFHNLSNNAKLNPLSAEYMFLN